MVPAECCNQRPLHAESLSPLSPAAGCGRAGPGGAPEPGLGSVGCRQPGGQCAVGGVLASVYLVVMDCIGGNTSK